MKNIIKITVGILLLGMAEIATAVPIQWQTVNGGNNHWYDIVVTDGNDFFSGLTTGINFQDARTAAERLGGYLATPNILGEADFIYSNLVAPTVESRREGLWLGAYSTGYSYTWVTGEPVTSWMSYAYIDWAEGYSQALMYFTNIWWTRSDALQDAPTDFPLNGFLVEYESLPPAEPVPEPSTLLLLTLGVTSAVLIKRRMQR